MWFRLCNFAADLQTTRKETTETNPRGESKRHNYAVKTFFEILLLNC